MRRFPVLVFIWSFASIPAFADDLDEEAVKKSGLPTNGPALLDFVRQRSRETADKDELSSFLKDLASSDPKVADKASGALVVRGPLAIPALRRAANDLGDKVLAERAKKALGQIEGKAGANLAAAVARLVALKRPEGSVEALLAYLPYADESSVLEAVGTTLGHLAYPDGKAHPALLQALESNVPVQRAIAVEALARTDHPETRPLIAKRLTDKASPVRQRAAMALARVEDVNAIPVLVELMGELTKAERVPVDEMLRGLAGETVPKNLPKGDDEKERKALHEAWADWWRKVDGPALVNEFRVRTLDPTELAKVADMVKKLGDGNYRVRERATLDLVGMGAKVLADLRVAAKDSDGERSKRAEDAITKINASANKRVPVGSARLVALRRPEGATEAMLAFLPYADEDDGMIAEVKSALTTLALDPNGKADAALVKAIGDPVPIRRSVAAEALAKGGGIVVRPTVKQLLADKDLLVRQAAAVALTVAGERDAVPVLIDLLAELSPAQTWPAQDLLYQLAGESGPTAIMGEKPEDRKKFRDLWADWWKTNAQSVDLVKLTTSPAYLGYTLIVEVGNNNMGRVAEIGRDGKVRWSIGNLRYPVDAFILPGERVLTTEWDGNRVAEWDFRGNLIWKKEGFSGRATNSQRLPTGNTFICTTSEMLEVDRTGKTLYQISVQGGITAAYRAVNGDIVCLRNDGNSGNVVRYDTSGKELKKFPSNRDSSWTSGLDLVRNGNVLVTQPNPGQKVSEYTPDGKLVKEWNTPNVTTATRLTNGHILASSHSESKVIELDESGKKVWEYKGESPIFRARRR